MATNLSFYIVSRDVALRTGDIGNCYKTADGRYVMDSRLLQRIRLTGDEYINGLDGIELVSRNEALTLIAQGGYNTDDIEKDSPDETADEASLEDGGGDGGRDNEDENTEKKEE